MSGERAINIKVGHGSVTPTGEDSRHQGMRPRLMSLFNEGSTDTEVFQYDANSLNSA